MIKLTTRMAIAGVERPVELERQKGAYWIARLPQRPETEVSGRTVQDALAALAKRVTATSITGDGEPPP